MPSQVIEMINPRRAANVRPPVVLIVFAILLIACSAIRGADDPPVKAERPVTKSDDAWQRLVYIPYRALKDILHDPKARAIVPLQEYLKLLDAVKSGAGRQPSLPAVVSASHYRAKIEKNFVQIRASLTLRAVEKDWSEALANFGDAAIGKLSSADARVLMRGVGRGTYAILLPKAGTYTVDLELSTRVHSSPDGRSFEFDCPAAGITTFELTVPEVDQTVDLTPQPILLPTDSEKGATYIKANLGATPHIAARWHPRVSTRPQMELLAGADNLLHVTLGDGVIRTDASIAYKVFRGELSQVRLAVPLGERILDISSPQGAIRSWKSTNEAGRQLVVVDLLANVSKEVTIEVHAERPLPGDGIELAGIGENGRVFGIHAVDVVRESGRLIVSRREGSELTVESEKGLVRVEANEVPAADRKADSSYYKFYSTNVRLRVEVRPVDPQIAVAERTQFIFAEDVLRLTSRLQYDVTRAGIFEIALKIPDGVAIDAVQCPQMKGYQVDTAAKKLLVRLNEKRQGTFELVVTAHRDLSGSAEIVLPLLEPIGVLREQGLAQAFVPEGVELISDDSKLVGGRPEPAANASAPQRNLRLAGSWSYNHRPVSIAVKTARKPTRLTATVATAVNVQQESAEVVSNIDFTVENAAIDTFRIAVPESVAEKVQIQLASGDGATSVKQQSRDDKAVEGWVSWTVVLQQKVTGRQRFRVKYDLKPTAAAPAGDNKSQPAPKPPEQSATAAISAEFTVALPQPQGLKAADGTERVALTQIQGEAAVLKDRSLSATGVATGGDVEPIDIRELKHLEQDGALAFRYEKQPVQLKLSVVKYGVQQVVETVVSRALIEAVVGRDASVVMRCRYLLKTSQRQRLAVDLPSGSSPLGLFLDGAPVALELNPTPGKSDGWTSYFVSMIRTKPSDQPVLLAVQFRRSLSPPPFESLGGRLKLALPRIAGGSAGNAVVQQLKTAIWIPSKYALVQTPGDFVAEWRRAPFLASLATGPAAASNSDAEELNHWIGVSSRSLFDFPAEGNLYVYSRLGPADALTTTWINSAAYTLAISLAVAIVAWLLRRRRWETLATFVLTIALIGVLAALLDREMVWNVLLAARYGLVALVAIWLIEAFSRLSPRPPRAVEPVPVVGESPEATPKENP
jgi:hypothetical protein